MPFRERRIPVPAGCKVLLLGAAVLMFAAAGFGAQLKVASLFGDGAVLQRDAVVPVWGTAAPGDAVEVSFAGQRKTAKADQDGRWRVSLEPVTVSSEPRTMSVSGADGAVLAIHDVLVGDVWLCAGQSNMGMRVDRARDAEKEVSSADLPLLRVFTVGYAPAREPQAECPGDWIHSTPETAGRFSATAFFFGRELHQRLGVPIGLIVAARGGSDITAWTSRDAQDAEPALKPLLRSWGEKDAAYTPAVEAEEKAAYETALSDWKTAIKSEAERPKKPRQPVNPRDHWHHPATLYNGMIAPLIPYALRGAIWYQGESNAFTEETAALYERQLPLLIRDWRARWGPGEFPFAWVQLPFSSATQVAWARIRESMRRALSEPRTGMVVTLDLGEERLLHPLNKQAFAQRLALWARAEVYGEDVAWSGPLIAGHRVGEKGTLLRFSHAEGLEAKDGALAGFEACSADGQWRPVVARINNGRVVVPHVEGAAPAAIRYAWANKPEHNLINAAGLPASPFLIEVRADQPVAVVARSTRKAKKAKPAPADLDRTPLQPADLAVFPTGTDRLEVFLLMGQSNMKGRGVMPTRSSPNPRIVMMHKRTDGIFLARHPLHLVGDPVDFSRADNAGVGPGLAFAEAVVAAQPDVRVLLVPCAVGGTAIGKWQKGQRLYDDTIRRAKLALAQGPTGKTRLAGALWLQGEADSGTPERTAKYAGLLDQLIDDLRADTGVADLPFIACTIGEFREDVEGRRRINAILLDLPKHKARTACVDGRSIAQSIGDLVHFDTPTQNEHGRRFAAKYFELIGR